LANSELSGKRAAPQGLAAAAAEKGDTDEVQSRLKKAGKWALGVATTIGTAVAAGAIKAAIGA